MSKWINVQYHRSKCSCTALSEFCLHFVFHLKYPIKRCVQIRGDCFPYLSKMGIVRNSLHCLRAKQISLFCYETHAYSIVRSFRVCVSGTVNRCRGNVVRTSKLYRSHHVLIFKFPTINPTWRQNAVV